MSKAEEVRSLCKNCGNVKVLGSRQILDSHSRCPECSAVGCIDYFIGDHI